MFKKSRVPNENAPGQWAKIPTLSAKESLILSMLVPGGEMYGLEIVRESDGGIKRGTVYVTVNRMEEKGYVDSRKEEKDPTVPGLPRRLYKATGYGISVFNLWQHAANTLLTPQFES